MSIPSWYQTAVTEMGTQEVAGSGNNPRIILYHQATGLAAKQDAIAWCGSFVAWCMAQNKIPYNRGMAASARSWESWGDALRDPIIGAVIVRKRGSNPKQGHVHFFAGWVEGQEGKRYRGLGGNQSDSVNIATFPWNSEVTAIRWPSNMPLPVANERLRDSTVIKAGVVATVAVATEIGKNATEVITQVQQARMNWDGSVFGLIITFVILCSIAVMILSRIKGKADAKKLEGTAAAPAKQ